jgi:hypothetical protein
MQKDTRFIIETVAIVYHIANVYYNAAIEEEPQRKTIDIDKRLIARLIGMAKSVTAGLNNNDRAKLEGLTDQMADHYGTPGNGGRIGQIGPRPEDLDIPESAIYSRDEPEKMREIPMWGLWTKLGKTLAVRISGPFACINKEGAITCRDGYLTLDSSGYPYPIDRKTFEQSYANELNEQIAGQCILADEPPKTTAEPAKNKPKKKPKAGKR